MTGLRKFVAGGNDDEKGTDGLFMADDASFSGEVRDCRASKGRNILMPSYLGSTRGLRPAQMGNSGLVERKE